MNGMKHMVEKMCLKKALLVLAYMHNFMYVQCLEE